jgi:hypothetical protein
MPGVNGYVTFRWLIGAVGGSLVFLFAVGGAVLSSQGDDAAQDKNELMRAQQQMERRLTNRMQRLEDKLDKILVPRVARE